MSQGLKIGVDGGGSKTECILVDAGGGIVARHVAPGCNPNVVGPAQARLVLTEALQALLAGVPAPTAAPASAAESKAIVATHLYVAGSRAFWLEVAGELRDVGRVVVANDSGPVLELATYGQPGLVLHAGTGSFVAARAPDGSLHYAGGLGWRFGDSGSGYDLGRRAIARAILEAQGWSPASPLGAAVRENAQLEPTADAAALTRFHYTHPEPNPLIASLAPAVLRLATEGEPAACEIVEVSAGELGDFATRVVARLFPATAPETIRAGLSGPILTHPFVRTVLHARSPLALAPIEGTPIEGVRRLLARDGGSG